MPRLTADNFAELFGTTVDRLPVDCMEKMEAGNWEYEPLSRSDRDDCVVEILDRIEQRKLTTVANEDVSRWNKGWGENLSDFNESNGDINTLVPKYIRPAQPVRLNQDFVSTADPLFELHWWEVFLSWFLQSNLAGYDHIYEFGSGSGFNVAELARLFPKASIHGLDWASPSVEIVEQLRKVKGLNVKGHAFDFFHPDFSLSFPLNSAVITLGALEQTGTNWGAFLNFLLEKRPRACFHVEPIYEWYDKSNLIDYTASKAHESRNFWRGFPQQLDILEKEGKVRINKRKRVFFGSITIEAYSQLFWEPSNYLR